MDGDEQHDDGRNGGGWSGTEADLREEPTSALVKDLFSNGQRLLEVELRLARAEPRAEVKKAASAGAALGVAGFLLHVALLLFAGFLVALSWRAFEPWAALLLVS